MFAGNEKISPYQLRCLIFTDWAAKLLLLLPRLRGPLGSLSYLGAVLLGGVWTFLYLLLLGSLSGCVSGSFTGFMKKRLGKYPACLADGLFLAYLLINQVYLARLTAHICRIFLLPQASETLIAAGVLLAGAATAAGSSQKRGRAAECLTVLTAAALALALAASVPSVHLENYRLSDGLDPGNLILRSGTVFSGFAGITLILFEMPHTNWQGRKKKAALLGGFGGTFLILFLFLAVLPGTFGETSLNRLPWPVLTLMSSVELPGAFLQRWDAVFLAILMFSLLAASGTCSHYMKRILGELLPKRQPDTLLDFSFGAALLLLLLTGSFDTAAALFSSWALCGLVPLTVLVPVLLYCLERMRKRCAS